jgi:hypothetical protein
MAFERYRHCEFMLPMDRDMLLDAADAAGVYEETRLLEVECGVGTGLSWIAKELGCGGLGVDPRERLVIEAARRAVRWGVGEHVAFAVRPIDDLGVGEQQFDVGLHLGPRYQLGEEGNAQFERAVLDDGALIVAEPVWLRERSELLSARFAEPEQMLEEEAQREAYERAGFHMAYCELAPKDAWLRFDEAFRRGLREERGIYETSAERSQELDRVLWAVDAFYADGGAEGVGVMLSVLEKGR